MSEDKDRAVVAFAFGFMCSLIGAFTIDIGGKYIGWFLLLFGIVVMLRVATKKRRRNEP